MCTSVWITSHIPLLKILSQDTTPFRWKKGGIRVKKVSKRRLKQAQRLIDETRAMEKLITPQTLSVAVYAAMMEKPEAPPAKIQ